MDASYRDAAGRLVNRRRQFGTMILSRLPIVSSRNHLLPKYATLTQHSIQQGALEGVSDHAERRTGSHLLAAPEPSRGRHSAAADRRSCSTSMRGRSAKAARGAAATRPRCRLDRRDDAADATATRSSWAISTSIGSARIRSDRGSAEPRIWSTQPYDRIRRRLGRRRTPRRRRRDDSERTTHRLLLSEPRAGRARPLMLDRYKRWLGPSALVGGDRPLR